MALAGRDGSMIGRDAGCGLWAPQLRATPPTPSTRAARLR